MAKVTLALILSLVFMQAFAQHSIELRTTTIKGNKELPKILYIVPWQEVKPDTKTVHQKLELHSLFGDLFDPVIPDTY